MRLVLPALALVGLVACSKSEPRSTAVDASVTATPIDAAAGSGVDAGVAASAHAAGPFNVLVISIDSLRADMPWAGYERPIAPNLVKLAAQSVRFTQAYSTSSFTSKSIPGLLTGRYPSELTRTGSFFTKYLDPEQFVCTHLKKEAIPCIGGHAHMYFAPGTSGFENGFSAWKIVPGITFDYQTDPWVTSDKLAPMAIEMLKTVSATQPFVAWFHFMDPHDEYKSHVESPHFGKKARDLYDEEVFFTDLWVGKLLDFVAAQPWAAKTAILLTADHGEAFGEHGQFVHGFELWQNLVHVPLFLHVPGVAARHIDVPRSDVDLAPTILDLLDVKDGRDPLALEGTSLVPELMGCATPERDVVLDLPMTSDSDKRRALIHGHLKIIAFGKEESLKLFDLDADPEEKTPILRGEAFDDMAHRFRERDKTIHEIAPFACQEKCLNRAYVKAGGK